MGMCLLTQVFHAKRWLSANKKSDPILKVKAAELYNLNCVATIKHEPVHIDNIFYGSNLSVFIA